MTTATKTEEKTRVPCGYCGGVGISNYHKDQPCEHCEGTGTVVPPPPPPPYHKFEIWISKQSESFFGKFRDGSRKPSLGSFNNVRLPLNSIADCMRVMELAEMDKDPWVWYITEHKSEHDTFGTRVMEHPLVARIENEEKIDREEHVKDSEDLVKRRNAESRVLEVKVDAGMGTYTFRFERSKAESDLRHSMEVRSYVNCYLRNPKGEETEFRPNRYFTKWQHNLRKKELLDDLIVWKKIDNKTSKAIVKLVPELRDLESRFEHGNLRPEDRKFEIPTGSKNHTVRSDKNND